MRGGATQMLVEEPDGAPTTVWDRPSTHVLQVPVAAQDQSEPIGVLKAGLNPCRPFDGDYHAVVDLFVRQIAAGLTAVGNLEVERQRAEALAAVDRARTAFFSNVSHEFCTPLTLMLGPLEDALAAPGQTPVQHERLAVAHRSSQRLLHLVNSLLDSSRVEAGRTEATFQPTDLAQLTAQLAASFRSATDRAGLRLICETPPLREPVTAIRRCGKGSSSIWYRTRSSSRSRALSRSRSN